MNTYINLIKKDIKLLKSNKYLYFAIIYPVFMGFGILTNSNNLITSNLIILGAMFFSIYMINFTILSIDNRNNSSIVYKSIPSNRILLVTYKYLLVFFTAIISIIFTYTIPVIISIINKSIIINYYPIILMFIFSIIFFSIYYPFYYKFGYNKMRIANTVIYFLIILLPFALNKFKEIVWIKPILDNIFETISVISNNIMLLTIFIVAMIVLSIIASVRFSYD